MMPNYQTRIFGYIRVSSAGQMDGDGPERQQDAINRFALRERMHLVSIFSESISGTIDGMNRPEFVQMLSMIDQLEETEDHIGAIVVERLDRLARDLMVQEFLIRELAKRKIMLFATDQGQVDLVDSSQDPTRKLIRQVLGALAEWEKSNIVHKLAVARARVKAETGRCGGGIAYGAKPGEGPVLEIMLSFRDTMSLRSLAEFLNNGGFRQRNGKPWTFSSVSNVLTNYHIRKEGTVKN